jgi:hypothetical protein
MMLSDDLEERFACRHVLFHGGFFIDGVELAYYFRVWRVLGRRRVEGRSVADGVQER